MKESYSDATLQSSYREWLPYHRLQPRRACSLTSSLRLKGRQHRAQDITDCIQTTARAIQAEQQKVDDGIDVDVGDKIPQHLQKKG